MTDADGGVGTGMVAVVIAGTPLEIQVAGVIHDAGRSQADDDHQGSIITRLQVVFTGPIDSLGPGAFTLLKNGSSEAPVQSATDNFFRLFGDTDGDADVDGVDLAAVHQAISGESRYAALRAVLDYNAVRGIDNSDYYQFRLRYGLRLP